MIERLQRIAETLARRGPGYCFYLLTGVLFPRLFQRLLRVTTLRRLLFALSLLAFLAAVLVSLPWGVVAGAGLFVMAAICVALSPWLLRKFQTRRWLAKARELPSPQPSPQLPTWQSWPLPESSRQALEPLLRIAPAGDTVIGRIDMDGLLATDVPDLPGFDSVPLSRFRPRVRFDLDLVVAEARPVLRKDFRGNRHAFAREWLALATLAGRAQVPAVLRADERSCRLYRTLVPGQPLNDLLVASGAQIRESQLEADREINELDPAVRLGAVLDRGKAHLPSTVSENFLDNLESEIDRIHSCGVTGLSLTFGNITAEAGTDRPWLFDFDGARIHASTKTPFFALHRDRDRENFNRIYGRKVITEGTARRLLSSMPGTYSPVDLGAGLTTRGFWSVDSGTGRWDFLNGKVLKDLLPNSRVLDLGSFNGVLPLLMLRAGARQVQAVEREPDLVSNARQLHELFEWRDMRRYDLTVHHADMRVILDEDWGTFDIVSAFCSLYYLDEGDMAKVARKAAELAPCLVLQAKTDTRGEAADNKAEKSSRQYLRRLLLSNGFNTVEEFAPPGYSRPLLIGRRAPDGV